jgi:peptide/nickel transport system substrate-binding protein
MKSRHGSLVAGSLIALGLTLGIGAALAVPKNTMVWHITEDPSTLDPHQAYDPVALAPLDNVYETLVTFKGNGKNPSEFAPMLATAWTVSSDGLKYGFTLRSGVKFHSGNLMTCTDAMYSFRRILVSNNGESPAWFLSLPLLGFDYFDDKSKAKLTFADLERAVSCDASGKLLFALKSKDPAFLAKLRVTSSAIVDSKYAMAGGEWSGTASDLKTAVGKNLGDSYLSKNPSGTGAYKLLKRDAEQLIFRAFDGYWGGKAKIENVILKKVENDAARILALQKGDADHIALDARASLKQLAGANGVRIIDNVPSATVVRMITMNQKIVKSELLGSGKLDGLGIPPTFFSDIHIRRGFALAFNNTRYINEVLGGKGRNRSMGLPEGYLGYDPKLRPTTYNLERAKAEFKLAWGGQVWKNGFTLIASHSAGVQIYQSGLELLKEGLEVINPKFKLTVRSRQTGAETEDGAAGKVPMSFTSWLADYPDSDNMLRSIYASNGGYYSRWLNHGDSKIDALLDQAYSTSDPVKRAAAYTQVGKRMNEAVTTVLVPADLGFRVVRSDLIGFENNINPLLSTDVRWKDLSK